MMQAKRLERSSSDKVLTGVAGGMADYLDVDPVLVRVGWVVLCFATAGIAFVAYIVMALVMPREGSSGGAQESVVENLEDLAEDASEFRQRMGERRERTRNWFAIGLIVVGAIALLANLGVFSFIDWGLIWPVALIAVGGAFLYTRMRR
jgi:phage shock protein PspC (stress-responsive transcriptional regulator)